LFPIVKLYANGDASFIAQIVSSFNEVPFFRRSDLPCLLELLATGLRKANLKGNAGLELTLKLKGGLIVVDFHLDE